MMILNSIVSTINLTLIIWSFLLWRSERTKTGKYGFVFLILLFIANTALIWM